ncbi:hypothetical protein BJ912DRAFT_1139487 [Pholiota molesta]|nr:hypothetical protein BJ912DRAFT_1139487 [Pholiota molesta]
MKLTTLTSLATLVMLGLPILAQDNSSTATTDVGPDATSTDPGQALKVPCRTTDGSLTTTTLDTASPITSSTTLLTTPSTTTATTTSSIITRTTPKATPISSTKPVNLPSTTVSVSKSGAFPTMGAKADRLAVGVVAGVLAAIVL